MGRAPCRSGGWINADVGREKLGQQQVKHEKWQGRREQWDGEMQTRLEAGRICAILSH